MRVIAGKYKGRKLLTLKNNDIRPTTDRIKEDIFNILYPYLRESIFLDLFSGSGSIGIEAVSRGAREVIMVDNNRESLKLMKSNADKVGIGSEIQIINGSAEKYLFKTDKKFDIIFLDPPYAFENKVGLLEIINEKKLLDEEGILVIEHDKSEKMPEDIGELRKKRTKTYSLTQLDFYTKGE